MNASKKMAMLRERLRQSPKLAVSFSGGVDSAFLLKAAVDAIGADGVLAITVKGANFPNREFREAEELVGSLGVRHLILDLDVMAIPGFAENSPERCYFCKKGIFSAIRQAAAENGFPVLADGANADDAGDYRPGMRAARELGVISPLLDVGMGKEDIRALSREMGLPRWDKPSFACLASRFPYGQAITPTDLEKVGAAEQYLLDLGFRNIRVRLHGDLARVEADPAEIGKFFDIGLLRRIDGELRKLGFSYVALDMRGYRTGSMNETLARGT